MPRNRLQTAAGRRAKVGTLHAAAVNPRLHVEVHDVPAHECVDGAAWRDLALESRGTPPQLLPGWQEVWWRRQATDKTHAVTLAAYRDTQLVGLLPLALRRGRSGLRVARVAGVDWAWSDGVLAAAGDRIEIARSLIESLAGTPYDVLCFDGLRTDSAVSSVCDLRTISLLPVPLVDLAETWEETFTNLMSKRSRDKLASKWRRFEREHSVTRVVHRDAAAISAAFPDYVRVHRARWSSLEMARHVRDVSPLADDVGVVFARYALCGLADDGVGRLLVIEADGVPVAFRQYAVIGDVLHGDRNEFDPAYARYSLGLLAIASAFEDAIADGVRLASLGNGNDEYKHHLTSRTEPVVRGVFAGHGVRGATAAVAVARGYELRATAHSLGAGSVKRVVRRFCAAFRSRSRHA